jgi:hypothetical protein
MLSVLRVKGGKGSQGQGRGITLSGILISSRSHVPDPMLGQHVH